jgi:hypothetical protein
MDNVTATRPLDFQVKDIERKIERLNATLMAYEDKVFSFETKIDKFAESVAQYMTAWDYWNNVTDDSFSLDFIHKLDSIASIMCNNLHIQTGLVPHPLQGMATTFPREVLEDRYSVMRQD